MGVIIALAALLLVLFGFATFFVRADPARMADSLRTLGPALLGLIGATMLVVGRSSIGGLLMVAAAGWYAWMRASRPPPRPVAAKRSTVRTAALEMDLDQDSGKLEGLVLAGHYEGRMLGAMGIVDLQQLYVELRPDPESRQLLETYLDGRFPAWRKDAQPDGGEGLRVAPGAGAMTKEEAYKVLGLEAGAAAADIRKAHRRLMQRLNADVGGTSVLAARINEAKDVLLSNHD
ncbi:molecular chaperone DnaJ [Mesorhizobium sp. M1C.F.Ca.ET.193.01.1.1]|uniref:molecular chaperone DnaJ n=1 Tax=unclassified Mesorhizobium TaxID=325217 RepID=UPI000FD232E9|nr:MULTISPECIES: molecular chaperone DnaJ [unclassified Mesorhizobium]TGT03533.1 molecular chaperone DnaJ [bacterium M00.F.Ca.ET.177.01.1.1]TGQ56217.1 molecular chaperone DnaJ [Mesorhizobium sp. M1C.F.Ca.ET.210.01.1.1]TGQ75303.1 molecular chaperone DnaJ [Mesorhizobium sp. M1C.F.Ca.ET.212.01.1.1]TGR13715.1 molecular chaperone DnaJ [Mesorhizobium sp. M1C.F.Ca.ET.204.01.1.1]TGR33989.1 molecular chaperone DnaJ [Mesorhizobium sp. M1C.F.Ca.ET.196.01.1.1]